MKEFGQTFRLLVRWPMMVIQLPLYSSINETLEDGMKNQVLLLTVERQPKGGPGIFVINCPIDDTGAVLNGVSINLSLSALKSSLAVGRVILLQLLGYEVAKKPLIFRMRPSEFQLIHAVEGKLDALLLNPAPSDLAREKGRIFCYLNADNEPFTVCLSHLFDAIIASYRFGHSC
jgi:hypothetical protein